MAKKLKKLPKKPKASASVAVMERYLKRVSEVKKENTRIESEKKKALTLRKKIAGIGR